MKVMGRTSIGFRLSLYVSAITAAVVVVVVAGLLLYAYQRQVRVIAANADRVATLTVPQLTASIWDYAGDRAHEQLDDLVGVEHLVWAELVTPDDTLHTGVRPAAGAVEHRFDLVHPQGGTIGQLRIAFSLAAARRAVLREAAALAAYTLAPLLLMAAATMLVFRRLVTRHLDALAVYVRSLSLGTMDRAFVFKRPGGGGADELDRLRAGIEAMRTNLLTEIRGRREAESRLGRVEERYRSVFNATGDAIFIHEAQTGRVLDVNETMLAMYRCTRNEALTAGPDEFTAEEQREGVAEALRRVQLAATGKPQVFEWYARRRSGEKFWVEVSLRSMAPADQDLVLAAVRDITARKEAEQRLQQMQRMETVGQLAGGIAHDFNNLLAGILGAAEMIELDTQQSEVREYARMIVGTTRRAADLTSKLLSYSRRGPVVLEAQDVHEIVADVAAILERSIDKRITLLTEAAAQRYLVSGDRSQLQSAILNLGLNARDAMPEGGVLTIATANLADNGGGHEGIEISVRDTGVGIDARVATRIFEPFFTTKQAGKGTGLGLAAVDTTVREHAGTVTFSSEPGRGTVFRVVLPLVAGEAPAAAPATPLVDGEGCVLVVDDEDAVREMMGRSLRKLGYRVLSAADGAEGLETFRHHADRIDLVILDMIMPRLSGPDTFAAIRAAAPGARIVVATGFSEDDAVDDLRAAGLQGVLRKPFQLAELSQVVARALAP